MHDGNSKILDCKIVLPNSKKEPKDHLSSLIIGYCYNVLWAAADSKFPTRKIYHAQTESSTTILLQRHDRTPIWGVSASSMGRIEFLWTQGDSRRQSRWKPRRSAVDNWMEDSSDVCHSFGRVWNCSRKAQNQSTDARVSYGSYRSVSEGQLRRNCTSTNHPWSMCLSNGFIIWGLAAWPEMDLAWMRFSKLPWKLKKFACNELKVQMEEDLRASAMFFSKFLRLGNNTIILLSFV